MQLEDPRGGGRNYKQLQNERCSTESIALQVSRIEAMQLHLIGKLTECVSLAAFTAEFTPQFPLPRGASEQQFDGRARFPGAGETAACTAQSVDQPTAVGLVTWTIGKLQQPCTLAWFYPVSLSRSAPQEMSSPLPFQRARLASNMSRRSTIQETSFSQQIDTHAVVTKIQNMFPTADENHIRLLLKR